MTHSTIELTASAEDRRVAGLAAAAIGLTLVEAAIPLPIPGIKPGLANIVTLVVLYRYGWRTAAWVAGLRIVAGALALGQFLTPAFMLSLAGGAMSLGILAAAIHLPPRWFPRELAGASWQLAPACGLNLLGLCQFLRSSGK